MQAREGDAPAAGAVRVVRLAFGENLEISFDLVSGEIRGEVVAEEGALVTNPHARLSWQSLPDEQGPGSSRRGESASGRFAFRGLPPGSYTLTLWADGRGVRVERVDLAGGEVRDLGEVLLPPETPLTVSVRWDDGRPVADGSVRVEDASGLPLPPLDRPGPEVPIRAGALRIGHLGPGTWRLRMVRPVRASLEIRLPGSGPVDLSWEVRRDAPKG